MEGNKSRYRISRQTKEIVLILGGECHRFPLVIQEFKNLFENSLLIRNRNFLPWFHINSSEMYLVAQLLQAWFNVVFVTHRHSSTADDHICINPKRIQCMNHIFIPLKHQSKEKCKK